ncbi:hypothetical protein X801_00986 [Opisthorchis viverrini]|uniref:Innexin n=1 Tax=Opisthorchis viverrini TaxID=6198 RepID=A0A1S8X8Q3_OPIVI|nr:hypothetical protein X801_00986 [Opisthorchis viverrini]
MCDLPYRSRHRHGGVQGHLLLQAQSRNVWIKPLWAMNTILPVRRVNYIKQYLKALRLISSTEERDCARFVNNTLGADGVFILHVVSKIASDLIALDVTATLWRNYRQAKITGTEEDVNRLLETVNRSSAVV